MTNPEKDPLDELADDLEQTGKEINNFARIAVKEMEATYDELDKQFNLKDRWIGAAVGGKAGVLVGAAGGPLALKTALIGAVTGFVVGDKGMKKYRGWRDQSETEKPSNNNDAPKSPDDGP